MSRMTRSDEIEFSTHSWGSIGWIFNGDLSPGTKMSLGHVVIDPGQKNTLHTHDNAEEYLYLIEGELAHSVGPDIVTLRAGDAIRVPAGVSHDALNVGPVPARMIVIYSDAHRAFAAHK
jgi:mannose-6-phosphate isomerase-like protein (cupin superfamily)